MLRRAHPHLPAQGQTSRNLSGCFVWLHLKLAGAKSQSRWRLRLALRQADGGHYGA